MNNTSYVIVDGKLLLRKYDKSSKLFEFDSWNDEQKSSDPSHFVPMEAPLRMYEEEVVDDFIDLKSDGLNNVYEHSTRASVLTVRTPPTSTSYLGRGPQGHASDPKYISSRLKFAESEGEIVDVLCSLNGSWSIVYYKANLDRLFVGRDVFGRCGILYSHSPHSLSFSYLAQPHSSWNDVVHGSVSVIRLQNPFKYLTFHSFLPSFPDDVHIPWIRLFSLTGIHNHIIYRPLITVSRCSTASSSVAPSVLLCNLRSAISRLIPPSSESPAVCFSGGIDSLLIARLMSDVLSTTLSIYLVNVAFGDSPQSVDTAPDRVRALNGLLYLRQSCPSRDWKLILVDVSRNVLSVVCDHFLSLCTPPSTSVLDESLSSVLFFALRAKGRDADTNEKLGCPSSIRFLGSGADELFAGYARHRTRYERDASTHGVAEECQMELRKLGKRNGGRDSRVAALLGVQLRCPFLDDSFVEWANSLPIEDKAQLNLPRGQGEKKIVREALALLDAPHTAPKQAMQFGSGMVKLVNSKGKKGSDTSENLGCSGN